MLALKIILVIFFMLLTVISFAGTLSDNETQENKKSYKELSGIYGALAIAAAVLVG